MTKYNSTIFKQETIQSWFSGVGNSVNNEIIQPFQNAEQVIWKYNQAIEHNSLTQKGWERLLAQSDDGLKSYLISIKGSTATMTGYNVSLQGNITGFKKVSSAISQYNVLSASGIKEQSTFADAVSITNGRLGTYLTGLNGAKASLGGYVTSLVGATMKTFALKAATIALNAALTMGISVIISGIVSAISEWAHKTENMISASEEAVDKIKSINDELKNNQKTISDTAERYAELAQGVDQLTGKNISLSDEDYKEFLNLSNQLAEMFPTLTRNYNDNGDAIVQLSGDVDTIVGSLQNLIDAQRDLANKQIVDELPTVFDGVAAKSDKYEQQLSDLESKRDTLIKSLGKVQDQEFSSNFMNGLSDKWIEISGNNLETISQMRDDYVKILKESKIDFEELTPNYEMKNGVEVPVGFTIKINSSDEDIKEAQNTINGKIQELAKQYETDIGKLNEEINTTNEKNKVNWTSLSNSIFAWLSTDDSFKVMDDTMQATVQNIVNSLDWGSLDFSSWEDAKQYIQENILSLFNTTEGKETLADIEVMFGIQTQFNNGDITVEEYQKKLQEFLSNIENLPPESKKSVLLLFGIQTNDDGTTTSNIDTKINNVKEKLKDEFDNKVGELTLEDLDIASKLEIPEGTLLSWDELISKINEAKNTSDKTDISFTDVFNSSDFADSKDKLLSLAKSGELSSKTLSSTEEYADLLKTVGGNAELAQSKIMDMLSVQEKLSAASQGIEKLKSSYEEFKNIGFVTAQTLESLPDVFKSLPSFNIFEKIVGNPESGKEKIQQAFNDIVKSYLLEENTLSGLVNASNSEVQTYIANLKQMGITNAEEIVKQAQKALNENNRLINAAELEYEKAHLNYINGKSKMDADYLTKVASKNSQLASALGSSYKQDYDNWCNLLSQKAEAYNDFVTAVGSAYDKSKGITENVNAAMANGVNAAYVNEQASKYINAKLDAKEASNKLKLDLKTIKVNFKSNYSPSTSGSGSNKGSSAKGSKGIKEAKKATAELFDFIERRLKKLEKAVDKAKGKIDELFSRKAKNSQLDKAIKATTNLINAELKAAKKYQAYADKIAGKAKKTSKQTVKISDSAGKAIVGSAKKYVGKLNYVWGGSSLVTGADCSGFTQQIFKKNGINIARTAQAQYNTTKGTKVTNKSKLKPGDLVFFGSSAKNITHVGIYAGNGKYVHSPHTGEKVKVSNLSGRKDFVGGVRASALNKTTTKTYKVKGLSSATVKKYIKLIENGSLTKNGLKSIKNEKLKKFINDYITWYDKAQEHIQKVEELKAQKRQYQLDKYQNYVDEAQTYIDKFNTQIENAPKASSKNALEKSKLKYIKQSYDYQIKIAEAEKDSLKVSQLKVEKEKELLAVKKEILQNSLDQNDKDTELLDAKYANATSVEEKNSIINEKNKINDKDVKDTENYRNDIKDDLTTISNKATKTTDKAKTLSDSDRKKINSCIKQGKAIPKSLLEKVKGIAPSLYSTLVSYNEKYANSSSIISLLNSSKASGKIKDNIHKAITSGKAISDSTLKALKKQDPALYKKAVGWNKGQSHREAVSKRVSNNKSLTKDDKNKINSCIKEGKAVPSDLMDKVKYANASLYNDLCEYNRYVEYLEDAEYQSDLQEEISKTEKRENIKEQFDNFIADNDNKSKIISDKRNAIQNALDIAQAKGQKIGSAYYTKQISLNNTELENQKKLREDLINQLAEIPKGTQEWYDAQDALFGVDSAIKQLEKDNIDLQNSINQLKFDRFDDLLDKINDIIDETDFLKDMLSDNLFDDNGMITDDGITAMGLTIQDYDTYLAEAEKYKQMQADLKEMYANGEIGDEEYESKMREYSQGQREMIKNAKDCKDATIDYVKQGLDAQNDALQKAIDKQKELLQKEKEERDFKKKIADQNKEIARLERQIAVTEGDTSDENKKNLRELRSKLQSLKDEQEDTFYDKSIEDQENALDEMLKNSQDQEEQYLKNANKVFVDAINYVNAHTEQVSKNIEKISKDIGYDISENITNTWKGVGEGTNTAEKAVGTYQDTLSSNVPHITEQIGMIVDKWKEVAKAAKEAAQAGVDKTTDEYGDFTGVGATDDNDDSDDQKGGSITRNKFTDFMNNNKSDSYTSKDLDNLLPIQKLILAYSGGKLYYGQDKLSKLLDTLGTNNPAVAANMFSTTFGTSISDANDAVNKIKNDTQQKEAYERDEKVRTEAEKKAIEESKKRDAKLNKLKEIDEFLDKNVVKASQKKEKYGTLNQYIYGKTGGKVLSKENEKKLASILGVKLKTDLTGKDGAEELKKIRDALKNAGFSKGGIVDLVRQTGEDGIALVKRKEGIFTPEQTSAIMKLANVAPKLNLPDFNRNIPIKNGTTPMSVNIDNRVTVEGVATDQIVKDFEKVAQKQAENTVAKINSLAYSKGVRRR